jgi:signal transduction histidine kinase
MEKRCNILDLLIVDCRPCSCKEPRVRAPQNDGVGDDEPVKAHLSSSRPDFALTTDITQGEVMKSRLIHREKLASLGLVVSSIAHEINNMNNCIIFNIPIMKEYLEELIPIIDDHAKKRQGFELFGMTYPEFRKDVFNLIENIQHASNRINGTMRNLKEFVARSCERKQRLVDLKEVIKRTIAICRPYVNKMVKSFEVHIAEEIPPIITDDGALEQVLINLLINAAQAADKEKPWIMLRVKQCTTRRDRFIIEVSDNGCGMDNQTRQKIFSPFFTTKTPEVGTGLGLFVSKNLIEVLDGRIEVESAPGRGSTFRVIIDDMKHRQKKNFVPAENNFYSRCIESLKRANAYS